MWSLAHGFNDRVLPIYLCLGVVFSTCASSTYQGQNAKANVPLRVFDSDIYDQNTAFTDRMI